jgi:hypothetical protein
MIHRHGKAILCPLLLRVAVALCAMAAVACGLRAEPGAADEKHVRELSAGLAERSTAPPTVSIPVAPLGFTAPSPLYFSRRHSLVSLDFVDEKHLLFTFRVPGLIRREQGAAADDEVHQIRAVLLELPSGAMDTEAVWTVHDHARYLWMLADGRFLLRDGLGLAEGDGSMNLKPLLHFPGPLAWLEMDPGQQYMISDSIEPVAAGAKPAAGSGDAAAGDAAADSQDVVVRILRRESGKVLLVSRAHAVLHLPINSQGYLQAVRSRGLQWTIVLNAFNGDSRTVGSLQSTCAPTLDFVTDNRLLAQSCNLYGERLLAGLADDGRLLWQDQVPATSIWPVFLHSADGTRLAMETLALRRPIGASVPLDLDDVKGQSVQVLDGSTGAPVFATVASPVLDAGGNAALSPSGRRLAVLNHGSIEVFDLPAVAAGSNPH